MMVYILMEHAFFDLQVGKKILNSLPSIAIHHVFFRLGLFPSEVGGWETQEIPSVATAKKKQGFLHLPRHVRHSNSWLVNLLLILMVIIYG